jgi:hypothetical protein
MPQKPYMCMCASLAEQLTYPNTSTLNTVLETANTFAPLSQWDCTQKELGIVSVKEGDRSGGAEPRTTVPVGSLDREKVTFALVAIQFNVSAIN